MMKKAMKGQSILEYTLVIAAVIAVLIFVMLGNGSNSLKNKIYHSYQRSTTTVDAANTDVDQGGVGVGAYKDTTAVTGDLPPAS